MDVLLLSRNYFAWHYTMGLVDFLHIWKNAFWVVQHVFSMGILLKTLFAPLKRLQEKPVNILNNPSDFFANMVVNLLMRIVGMCIRLLMLTFALAALLLVLVFGLIVFIFWLAAPVVMIYLLFKSIGLIIGYAP